MAILSAIVMTMLAGYSAIERMTLRDQDRLNASEVAHQLILNYLYDPNSLPDDSLPIENGKGRYRYRLSEEVLVEQEKTGRITVRKPQSMATSTRDERLASALVMVTVNVYPDLGADRVRGEPLLSLSRIFNPYSVIEGDDDMLIKHVEKLLGRRLNLPNTSSGGDQ